MSEFQDYIADVLTGHIAESKSPDFIITQGDDLVYVDVEDSQLYLISIAKAEAYTRHLAYKPPSA